MTPTSEKHKLREEVRSAQSPIQRKPDWIKTRAKVRPENTAHRSLAKRQGLHSVCQSAGCPNIVGCCEYKEATFLIGWELVTLTRYLCPSAPHYPVERWVKPEEFVELEDDADQIAFSGVMPGRQVRSSYRVVRICWTAVERRGAPCL